MWKRGLARITTTTRTAPANANHLICCRSSPLARRHRTISEAADMSPSTNMRRMPKTWMLYATLKLWGAAAGASSLILVSSGPRIGHAVIATGTIRAIRSNAAIHARGRQRRDRSRPSGNSNSTNVNSSMIPGGHTHVATHEKKDPNGSAPGSRTSA
jgi:hypothetical protein